MTDAPWDPSEPVRGLRFATQRDPNYPTRGDLDLHFSRIWLNRTLMPVQKLIVDVAGEYDPDTGLPRHSLIVVAGPRQMGKSDLCLVCNARGAMTRNPDAPPWKAWYTAQTGLAARDQFLKFVDSTLDGTALQTISHIYRGAGREQWSLVGTGASVRPHPPTEKALHGEQSNRNDIDEAWAFSRAQGQQLLQAIGPTQLTRPGAQTWIWSAGGTPESTWLADYMARGREGDPSFCFFDLGVPDDEDPLDLDTVFRYHPAAGYTITLDSLAALRQLLPDDDEWARAAANQWSAILKGAIELRNWANQERREPIPYDVPVGYGAALALDQSHTTIAAAARVDDTIVVELIDLRPGVYEAAGHVNQATLDGPLRAVDEGASAPLAVGLGKLNQKRFKPLPVRDYAAATSTFIAGVNEGRIFHRPDAFSVLDDTIKAAGTRPHQDGGRIWSRIASGGSIAALEAMTAAVVALDDPRPPRRAYTRVS